MELKKSISLVLIQESRTVIVDDQKLIIEELTPYYKHGDGFAWGYGGRGPHDLAWGICYRLYGKFWASLLYGHFLETYVKQWSWNTPEHKLIVDLTAINEIIVKIPIITVKWEIELHEFDPEIKDFVENGTVKDEVIEFKDIPYDHNTGLYSTDRAMFKILKEKHGDGWYAVKFQPKLISSKNIITMKTKKITHDEKCSKIKEILSPYCLNGEIVNIGETLDEYTVYISAKHIVSSNIRIPLGNELISHHSLKDEDAIKMYNLGLIWYEKLNIWMF